MEHSDSQTPIPPHFVTFAGRYRAVPIVRSRGLRARFPTGLDLLISRSPSRHFTRRRLDLPGSWGIPGVGLPRSLTPAKLLAPGRYSAGVLSPVDTTPTTSATCAFRGSLTQPSHLLSTLRSRRYRTTTQDSLPAGGQPLPGGIRTRRVPFRRFQVSVDCMSTSSFLLLQALPGARCLAPHRGHRGVVIYRHGAGQRHAGPLCPGIGHAFGATRRER